MTLTRRMVSIVNIAVALVGFGVSIGQGDMFAGAYFSLRLLLVIWAMALILWWFGLISMEPTEQPSTQTEVEA